MALTTEEAAVNTAVDTLVTALAALYAAKGVNETIIFIAPQMSATGLNSTPATTPDFSTDAKTQKRLYVWRGIKAAGVHENNNFWGGPTGEGNFFPIWKVTNDAGAIT